MLAYVFCMLHVHIALAMSYTHGTSVPTRILEGRIAGKWSTSTEMDRRHPGLVRHVGGALHSDSKEQTAMEETGSI